MDTRCASNSCHMNHKAAKVQVVRAFPCCDPDCYLNKMCWFWQAPSHMSGRISLQTWQNNVLLCPRLLLQDKKGMTISTRWLGVIHQNKLKSSLVMPVLELSPKLKNTQLQSLTSLSRKAWWHLKGLSHPDDPFQCAWTNPPPSPLSLLWARAESQKHRSPSGTSMNYHRDPGPSTDHHRVSPHRHPLNIKLF